MHPDGITAVEARDLSGVTYRQLDYWVRKGWVTPSLDPGHGKSSRRLFDIDDVVRLGVLCHLGRSRRNLTELGPKVQDLDLSGRFVIVSEADEVVTQAGDEEMIAVIRAPGLYTVCDVAMLRDRVVAFVERAHTAPEMDVTASPLRRAL
jgi:DNA-binding transcriptional MerR regulator